MQEKMVGNMMKKIMDLHKIKQLDNISFNYQPKIGQKHKILKEKVQGTIFVIISRRNKNILIHGGGE